MVHKGDFIEWVTGITQSNKVCYRFKAYKINGYKGIGNNVTLFIYKNKIYRIRHRVYIHILPKCLFNINVMKMVLYCYRFNKNKA